MGTTYDLDDGQARRRLAKRTLCKGEERIRDNKNFGRWYKRIAFSLVSVRAVAGIVLQSTHLDKLDEEAAPTFVTRIPTGYRGWGRISVAREEGNLHSFAGLE